MDRRKQLHTFSTWLVTNVLFGFLLQTNAEHSCHFDYGLCFGWSQSYWDDFDWTNEYGSTPSYDTGPSSDHSGYGSYMYIETSYPRQYGENAKLEFSVSSYDIGKLSCLKFYYHMYGETINTLNVYNGYTEMFTESGNQGNAWLSAKITMTLQSKITFEGIRGDSFTGDIAIDDVSIVDGICQECTENVNQSFGQLDIRYSNRFDPYCIWIVENAGIPQAVAIISIHHLNFTCYGSDYVKLYDGNGTEVFARHGWDSTAPSTSLQQVSFGESRNITIQVSLVDPWSYVKINYGMLRQPLTSATLLSGWSVAVVSKTARTIGISWSSPISPLNGGIHFYVALVRKINSSSESVGEVVAGNVTSAEITELDEYTEYKVSVIAVDGDGMPFKSAEVLVMTDEWVPSKAPNGLRVTSFNFSSDLLVEWNSLPQQYANGKLLGYTIYYQDYNIFWSPYKSVNTSSPSATRFTLKGLKPANEYLVAVAAFTSKGEGPWSAHEYAVTGCSATLNETFGQIELTTTSYHDVRCNWKIHSVGISEAVAFITVQELNLYYCSEFVKIINGYGNEVLYHLGCVSFAPEILADVPFGLSSNISIQVFTQSYGNSVKMTYAIVKKGLASAMMVSGWNVTVFNLSSTSFNIHWTKLDKVVNRFAKFYIVEIKSFQGTILTVETVPGNATSTIIKGLGPSTKYFVVVFGVDSTGHPYKSLETDITTTTVTCGSRPSASRIVGGTVAPANSWPWQVMMTNQYGYHFCGGSLVDIYWVLTAAHCVDGKTPASVRIRLGAHYKTNGSVGTEQDIRVAKMIMHENYGFPLSLSNDIALINLASPADLGKGVSLVCLPDTDNQLPFDNPNKTCWTTGWGRLYHWGPSPNTLMQVSVPLVSKQRCESAYPSKIDDSMLCVGRDEGGISPCNGDSGGPLVCEFNGTWYLEGATSWGYGCDHFAMYANIRDLKSWILTNMYTVIAPSASPNNQSSSALVWCDFDHGLCSGWSQSSADDFDWTLGSGSTPSSSTGPTHDQGGSGNYMYIEASSPRKPGENAKLVLTVPNSGNQSCLSFYYHMYGTSTGTLNVYNGNINVFTVSGNQGDNWLIVERNLNLDGVVTFEGITGSSYTGDVAIDQVKITEGGCPVSCDFDNGLCTGWSQSTSDVFDWTLNSGPTWSSSTGPSSDLSGTGNYMYTEATVQSAGDNAKLQLVVPNGGSSSCLTFFYHMYGYSMGTLNVFNGNTKIFSASGDQGNYWRKVRRTVDLSDVLTFEGIIGWSYTSDIAIDNVTLTEGDCLAPATTSCDFDSGLCFDWEQSLADVFDWTRHTGPTSSDGTGPNYDHTSGTGYYMYIETSLPRAAGDNAKLELSVSGNGELSCLKFYYHMYGDSMGTLNVYSGNLLVFRSSGNHGNHWKKAVVSIHLDSIVTFEGIAGSSYTSDLAIDDVAISSGSCPVPITSCDFDTGLCNGWRQSCLDVFDWAHWTGSTWSSNTGPDFDHTSGSGYYMYIETSSPRVAGDNAKLVFSVSGNGQLSCLEFYYHMHGDTMGTLNIFSGNSLVFSLSGNQGDYWIKVEKTIFLDNTVTFEGIAGTSFTGDLAIDDVSITNGSCQGQPAPPVSLPTASTALASTSCSFDNGLCCDWQQSITDVFDWTINTGSTGSLNTGPDHDHTSGLGSYAYIETSSPRQYGDNAKLEFSVSNSEIGKLSCLRFYYHMYGVTINTLNVYNGITKVFTKSGNQGNIWLNAKLTMTLQATITFEGIRGYSYTGDIAIDDVSIVKGICQECLENLNQSFGRLSVSYSNRFDPYCNWTIGNAGIPQAVAIVTIHHMNFSSYGSEYVKIFDGNGSEVFARHGWNSTSSNKSSSLLQISFEDSKNITIQVSLINQWSDVKIAYGILKKPLNLASLLAGWSVTVVNKTARSIGISWNSPTSLLNGGIRFYVTLARKTNSSNESIGEILAGNVIASEITELDEYTEYNVSVVAVDGNGMPFKSAEFLVVTDEGVPSRAPNGLQVTGFEFTSDLQVKWNPLQQQYVNGKLLGYTIFYRDYNIVWSTYKSVNTSSPSPTRFTLKGLKLAHEYLVAVAAFTSKGVGPWSAHEYAVTGCSTTLNETFGQIEFTTTSYRDFRCNWRIHSAGISEAVAFISVQELNLYYCSEFVKIIDGNDTEVLYHLGCVSFAPEILADVPFGLSNNISIQVYTQSYGNSVKMKYAILKEGLASAIPVLGWNATILNVTSSYFNLQWTRLYTVVSQHANFYIIEVKSVQGTVLTLETVPGDTTSTVIKGLKPSSKYRVGVFGIGSTGQPYKSLESVTTTKEVLCGFRPSTSRIVGGTVAPVNSWPWQVMVINEYGNHFCGGSLVDPYWVMTAAHCMTGRTPSGIKIRLGAHYRTYGSVGTEQDIDVAKIIMHENYEIPLHKSNDIALLNLASPAELGAGVGLVCLPDTGHQLPFDNLNKRCWITGWGHLSFWGSSPNTLMQASLPLVSKQRCENAYPGEIDDSMLCAGLDEGGIDTCQGDSGGPLVCEFNGTWYLEGVTSWGYGCAEPGNYGVYAKVRALRSWLSTNMFTVVAPSASPQNQSLPQSSSAIGWCNFDHGLCSGWNQSSSDDFDWTLASGSTPSSSTGPAHGQGGTGKYMYIEASYPRKPGEIAKLVVTVPNNGNQSCLSFYYHMFGASAGTLNVYSGNLKVFTATGNKGDNWFMMEASLYLDGVVTFEGIIGSSYTGDVSIDEVRITEGSCPVSCGFENGLCLGWSQSTSDVFDWTLNSGPTSSWSTGPSSDLSGTGKYMYTEATVQSAGDNAKLQLEVPSGNSISCLTFFYHMYGYSMGTLNVFNGNTTIFTASGDQGNYWRKVARTVNSSEVLTFEGIVGWSYTSDIAIDNVTVSDGNCPVSLSCNFDNGLCDGWEQSYSDVFDWTLKMGSTGSSDTGPDYDHTSGKGYYMYIETSSPRVAGDNAKLEVSVPGSGELSCLTFYYHMYGAAMGTLNVFSGNALVFQTSGNHGNHWKKAEATIFQQNIVTFEGIAGSSYTSDLAIDDVVISSGSCPAPTSTSCDFDAELCQGWRQSCSDVFDWTRRTGSTSSLDTGPDFDHTSGSGYYMYIETSLPRVAGDNAKLEVSVSGNRQLSCLEFYYHMYGNTMGTLNVFSGNALVFSLSGNQGNYWIKVEKTIYLDNTVTFEGIAGSSYTGDLAIDDVSISNGSCQGQASPPPSLPTVSPALNITSCNFDSGFCCWRQSNLDVFDWTLNTGPTGSSNTGPDYDHTSGSGSYVYIETSSPRQYGDNAKLEYLVSNSEIGKLACLSFYYHMHGETINTLNVYNGITKSFTRTGNHGNEWLNAKLTMTLQTTITFEGIRGYSYTGDIAIDDVSIVNGNCPECIENVNQSFGGLDISYSKKFDPYCNWIIANAGIPQAVAIISIHHMNFSGYGSEYVTMFDGNGGEVFARHGWNSNTSSSLQQIFFEDSKNITIQVSLISRWSSVKISYGILKKPLNLASHLPGWSITVISKTAKSIGISWSSPASLPNGGIRFYVALARKVNGSSESVGEILAENTTASVITELDAYTEYSVIVLAVDGDMIPHKSAEALVMTDEGVPSRAPNGLRVTSFEFTSDLLVQWNPLPQQYVNGKLLGYTIYYRDYNIIWSTYKSINTSSPYSTQATLTGLKSAHEYLVAVAAFTSKGGGPWSAHEYAVTGCSTTLNETFGQIEFTTTSYRDVRCNWKIHGAGISKAVAFISVQELNLYYCSEFVKIIDGNGTELLYHLGCVSFAPEILADVPFGLSNNISIQVYTQSYGNSIKMKYAILKEGLASAIPVLGWNATIFNLSSTTFNLQWTKLYTVVNQYAQFYIIEVKSVQGIVLTVETVPGNITSTVIKELKPSSKYRVGVFGIDSAGQPYKSLESVATTKEVFCGFRPTSSTSRIVGGTVAPVNSWPWQAMVTDKYGNHFCGASLLDPSWLVTAAHCLTGKSPSDVKIRLGAHYRTYGSVGTEQDIDVAKIIMHENYEFPLYHSNDIALLNLASPAELGVGVGLVCLPDTGHLLPFDNLNKRCWITGWGHLSFWGSFPNTLMQASLPLVSKKRCENAYPGDIDDSMLCAGLDEGGIDTCQGDSGGPLVCEFNGTWYLEGVTSWGYRCAEPDHYGVYANVRALRSWILTNMYTVVAPSASPQNPSLPQNQTPSALAWCNFDHGLCSGWNQSSSDDFDWTLASGSTPSSSTGPGDGQGGQGKYMYIEASYPRKPGEIAKLVVTVPNNGNQSCLSFYYHMYGASAGTLNVYSGNLKVFTATGNKGDNWFTMVTNLYLDGVVTFEGIIGTSYTGDVAIDGVKITEGSCPVSCGFENGLCPGWSQSTLDVFDWTLNSGPTSSSSTGPSSDLSGTGKYMYTEATVQSAGDNAKLQLVVPNGGSSSCLTFFYHMYGYSMGTLNVFNGNTTVFTASGDHGDKWSKVIRTVNSSDVLTFEGIIGWSYTSDIAIDNVTVIEGSCPVSTSCNFDSGLCDGWEQSYSDIFDWTLNTGSTWSSDTGPDYDHTSGTGYYMYIEASSPRVAGDNAKLEFSVPRNGELSCLEFYYHMYGDTMGTLTVFSGSAVVFNTSGNHDNTWIKADITIHLDSIVTFEGIVGSSYTGDLAIDDVSISSGSCQGHTTSPTFSTTSLFSPSMNSTSFPSTFNPSSNHASSSSGSPTFSSPSSQASSSSEPSTFSPPSSQASSSSGSPTSSPLSSQASSSSAPSTSSPPSSQASSSSGPPSSSPPSSQAPSTKGPTSSSSLPSSDLPGTLTSSIAPPTPSIEETQETVEMEIRGLNIDEWDDQMESNFKREVATAATDYCSDEGTRCGLTPSSSRRRRSSDKIIFTPDMVHIFPGYPKESTDDPSITLLAFFLQLPQEFSDNIVNKDVLKAIVESDESSIGGSMGGTITGVRPFKSTTETTEKSHEEPKSKNAIFIGASVGGVILVVVIVILLLRFKKKKRLTAAKKKEGNSFNNSSYLNDAYCIGSGEQAMEMKCGDQAFSSGIYNVPDCGEHNYAAVNDMHASSDHPVVVLKFPDSLAGKNGEDVASPIYHALKSGDAPINQPINSGVDALIYQTLESGVDAPVNQSINSGVDAPIYQTLESGVDAHIYQPINSGVDAPIYQPINRGVDAPIYQPLNSNRKSPDVRAEKTSEDNAEPVCQLPNNGANASMYQTLNKFSEA